MIFSAATPPTTGPAVTTRSGEGHFGPAAPPTAAEPITAVLAPPAATSASMGPEDNTKWWVIGILGVAAVGGGAYYFTRKKR